MILADTRIGMLGKGGSGKSTLTVLLARELNAHGYRVCVLDADSTNTGRHQALGFDAPPISLLEYFGGPVFSGGAVTCPVDDPAPLTNALIDLNTIPDTYYVSDRGRLLLFQFGKIGDKGPGAGCDGPISKIARDLRIGKAEKDVVTLIDVKAGMEDSARGVITSMDCIITVVDPSTAAIQIAHDVKNLIARIRTGELPATQHLTSPEHVRETRKIYREARIQSSFAILDKVRERTAEAYMTARLRAAGMQVIGVICDEPAITVSWLEGTPLQGADVHRRAGVSVDRPEQHMKGTRRPEDA